MPKFQQFSQHYYSFKNQRLVWEVGEQEVLGGDDDDTDAEHLMEETTSDAGEWLSAMKRIGFIRKRCDETTIKAKDEGWGVVDSALCNIKSHEKLMYVTDFADNLLRLLDKKAYDPSKNEWNEKLQTRESRWEALSNKFPKKEDLENLMELAARYEVATRADVYHQNQEGPVADSDESAIDYEKGKLKVIFKIPGEKPGKYELQEESVFMFKLDDVRKLFRGIVAEAIKYHKKEQDKAVARAEKEKTSAEISKDLPKMTDETFEEIMAKRKEEQRILRERNIEQYEIMINNARSVASPETAKEFLVNIAGDYFPDELIEEMAPIFYKRSKMIADAEIDYSDEGIGSLKLPDYDEFIRAEEALGKSFADYYGAQGIDIYREPKKIPYKDKIILLQIKEIFEL